MLRTTDNNCGKNCTVLAKDLANFQQIAKININNQDANANFLFFSNQKEKIIAERVFTLDNNILTTNNIMGFIGLNGSELTIQSRFADDKDDKQDYFLHYMLQKVFSINLYDLEHSTDEETIFDFLLYLFPFYLNKALQQGIYKEYRRKEYNNANVKGTVNIARHIKNNIPFTGNIAYSAREHSYDNNITQLIRHTIEVIKKHKVAQNLLASDNETYNHVNEIIKATPSFESRKKRAIINRNLRPLAHPYFLEYKGLQKLCLQILNYEKLKYGQEKDKIYGLLFDGAWLWEEYLNTILKDCGFQHPRNDFGKDAIYLFESNKYPRYPDFYKDKMVIDAKYKRLEDKSKPIDRNDMNQIISYMYVLQAELGIFLYPVKSLDNSDNIKDEEIGKLKGYGNLVKKWGFPIPQQANNFQQFCELMQANEKSMRNVIVKQKARLSTETSEDIR